MKVEVLNDIQPLPGTAGYGTVLRSLRTPFMDEWGAKREEGGLGSANAFGQRSGKSPGRPVGATRRCSRQVIKEVFPVAEIMRQLIAEAEAVMSRGARLA